MLAVIFSLAIAFLASLGFLFLALLFAFRKPLNKLFSILYEQIKTAKQA